MDAWAKHIEAWNAQGTAHGSIAFPARVTATPAETKKYLDATARSLQSPWTIQAYELLKRSLVDNMRDKQTMIGQIVMTLGFATFVAAIFNDLTPNVTGISDRMGLLFLVTANMAFSVMAIMIYSFPPVKAVYIREQASGSYSPFWFLVTKQIADFPLQLIMTVAQSALIYFSVKLYLAPGNFFTFLGTLLLLQQTVVGLGWILSTASPNAIVSSSVMPVILTPMMLTSGLLTSTNRLSPYWDWLERISFLRQAFMVIAHKEFGSLGNLSCDLPSTECSTQPTNGYEAEVAYGLTDSADADWVDFLCLCLMFFIFRAIALFALHRVGRAKE